MSKWEREPKQHYRESPWAPFDLLGLFPLKSQLSKTFFFLNSVILLLEPSLLFQIHLPPTLPPSCSVIGGDGALSAMRGPAHQSESVVMPLQSDTGGGGGGGVFFGWGGWRGGGGGRPGLGGGGPAPQAGWVERVGEGGGGGGGGQCADSACVEKEGWRGRRRSDAGRD